MGSPPPTRGTLVIVVHNSAINRITPAYAGNTLRDATCVATPKDHPRLRGEHISVDLSKYDGQGSPPPTRGTPQRKQTDDRPVRITPAYAGNTLHYRTKKKICRDHPRLRGEHQYPHHSYAPELGSPPPTRGTPGDAQKELASMRITPAYAGNTMG